MATSPLQPIVKAFDLTTSYQNVYTVPSDKLGIGIDAVVFNNYSSSNITYSVRLVQTGTATVLNEIITESSIRAKDNNLAPAMIGQALIKGGIIQAKASANTSVSLDITATIIDS